MCDSGIEDQCEYCGKSYAWNACHDCYCHAESKEVIVGDKTLTLWICDGLVDGIKCGAVFAVSVLDDNGELVLTPSQKEL